MGIAPACSVETAGAAGAAVGTVGVMVAVVPQPAVLSKTNIASAKTNNLVTKCFTIFSPSKVCLSAISPLFQTFLKEILR
jgi:hypothetical protein